MRLPRSKLLFLLAGSVVLVGLYALLGFQLAPRILRARAVDFVREEYGRELGLGEVRVHPFKLYVEIEHIALPDADGAPLIGCDRLLVDFEALSSMWERAYVFRTITLTRPTLRPVVRPNGALNLADLAGKPSPEPTREQPRSLPALWIQELTIRDTQVEFIDRARPQAFTWRLPSASFALTDFRTTKEGGTFGLTAVGAEGEKFSWNGKVMFTPELGSSGTLTVEQLPLATLAAYLGDEIAFVVSKGTLGLTLHYKLKLGDKPRVSLRLPRLTLRDLSLRARGARAAQIEVPTITVTDAQAVLEERTLKVSQLRVDGMNVRARREPDGSLDLAALFPPSKEARDPGAVSSSPPWRVSLASLALENTSIALEDATITPSVRLQVAPLALTLSDLSLDLAKPLPITLDASIEKQARVHVSGTLTPSPLAATLDVRAQRLPITRAQPYLHPHAALTIRDGELGIDGSVVIAPAGGATPEVSFRGDVVVTDFRSIDDALRQGLVEVKRLELKRARFAYRPDSLSIDRVLVQDAYARVFLSKQQVLNLSTVLRPEASSPSALKAAGPATKTASPSAAGSTSSAPMPIQIGAIAFEGTRLSFADYFIEPNFAAEIQALHGTLSGLSSDPKSRSTIMLQGKLGKVASVKISGRLQPFAYDRFSDIRFRVENVALPIFNPYSGRFAGYSIAEGELSTELRYKLYNRKLEAAHSVRIDQLRWGEQTATKGEAPLPVKLATALLRDRHGVILLDLPVQGTLDDPSFSVWPVVWQIVKNIIVKAAFAPFDLLGSLFRGAEKARFIDFAPGSAELDQAAREGLSALAKAMQERPTLSVDVPLGAIAPLDRPALAEQKYQQSLQTVIASTFRTRDKGAPLPTFDSLELDQKLEVLEELYRERTGASPDYPEAPERPEGMSRKDGRALKKRAQVQFLEGALRKKTTVESLELDALGERRAETIEAALLASGELASTRVVLSKQAHVTAEKSRVRFELTFR